jgi:hypothetical protein
VLIAIRRHLSVRSSKVTTMPGSAAELIEISIDLRSHCETQSLHIYCGYFPHCPLHLECLYTLFEYISDAVIVNPDDQFLIVGDFNVSSAQWSYIGAALNVNNSGTSGDRLVQALHTFLSFTGLTHNEIYNYIHTYTYHSRFIPGGVAEVSQIFL